MNCITCQINPSEMVLCTVMDKQSNEELQTLSTNTSIQKVSEAITAESRHSVTCTCLFSHQIPPLEEVVEELEHHDWQSFTQVTTCMQSNLDKCIIILVMQNAFYLYIFILVFL